MFDAAREKTRLWLLILVGVVATLLGQTHARQIFAPSPHGSGVFATSTPATTGDFYDADRYDVPDSLLAANSGGKIPWGFWDDYAKVTVNGREYAQVGSRLYTHHAVDRMIPSGFGTAAGAKVGDGAGRSISPNFIEDVITTGTRTDVQVNGVTRSIYTSGSVEVVTEGAGRTVITVNPFKN